MRCRLRILAFLPGRSDDPASPPHGPHVERERRPMRTIPAVARVLMLVALQSVTASCSRYEPSRSIGTRQVDPRLLSVMPWHGKLRTASQDGQTNTYHYDWFGRVSYVSR